MIIIITSQWCLTEGITMQRCRYFVCLVQNGGFTAVAAKIAFKWKIKLRGLGDICRISYEKWSRPRTPYVHVHKVWISAGLLAFCYDIHCHFVFARSHTRPWFIAPALSVTKFSTGMYFLAKNTKFEYFLRIRNTFDIVALSKDIYVLLFIKTWCGGVCGTIFHAFFRDTIRNLFCNNRNILLLWCGVRILTRS